MIGRSEVLGGEDRAIRMQRNHRVPLMTMPGPPASLVAEKLVDDTLAGLAENLDQLTCSHDIDPTALEATVDAFDANFAHKQALIEQTCSDNFR